jgi:hypothetical protein
VFGANMDGALGVRRRVGGDMAVLKTGMVARYFDLP